MRPPKISVVFGTRPEAIKLAPLVLAGRADDRFALEVCVTGQHRQMLDQVLDAFRIRPDVDLNLMAPSQTLADLTARTLTTLDAHFANSKPDLVLVQGDTTTVLAAALAAFYRRIPVGHVEAGLRTGNLQSPFPEEANRQLTTRLAALHFAPTQSAADNLLGEGTPADRVHVTGNTVIDALLHAVREIETNPPPVPGVPLSEWPADRQFVLITGHRRENFGAGFEQMCAAIAHLAAQFPDVAFVYPVHLNPNVREPVHRILRGRPNVFLTEPQGYREFLELFRRCTLVLTDSGGVQEEAPTLNKPVLVMRDTTERPEGVAVGAVKLVGPSFEGIVGGVSELLTNPAAYRAMTGKPNPYGDGKASQRILDTCATFLGR
ncbi:non-hydrolyzing UDP-N-acetylglucosamine 2-epimerase [Limnoglobus roseus]|uniref:UDP-N-acetylglucosamine 2-epimerase (non-hydrolyzing) n=1 Tax=Limnoglobus roseus TaxID=2598579 RepID=A0A5C1AL85_9BACT|nr:UDP-N-acetylglucosamine 2-epimerase (non-hydrolyzing) [Limnoglobus roseus]QEL18492.1 UDP-N-acetylglucosamine 2-epimerase (non-hydrolyzing) [Limnoglobus roseus]